MNTAFSQDKPFGAGIILIEPTGISLKYWVSKESAFDLAIAWSFSGEDSFYLHGDYLLHNLGLIHVPKGKLPLYYGAGARYRSRDNEGRHKDHNDNHDDLLGIRIPIGVEYLFDEISLGVFIEIAPILNIIPDTDLDLSLATGARFFF